MQLVQVVLPELILDEECHAGIHDVQELLHIALLVERQVADHVSPPVILTNLIARRRKERQQYTVVRILGTDLLYQRTSLLKFAQGSGMEPDIAHILLQLLSEQLIHHPVPLHHLTGFTAERSRQMHQKIIDAYRKVVKHTH